MKANFNIKGAVESKKTRKKVFKSRSVPYNKGLELDYYRLLNRMILGATEAFLTKVAEPLDTKAVKSVVNDAPFDIVKRLDKLISKWKIAVNSMFQDKELIKKAKIYISSADKISKAKFLTAVDYGFGIDISNIPEFKSYKDYIRLQVRRNLALIKSLKAEHLDKLELMLRKAVEQGYSIEQVKREVLKVKKISQKRASLIARNEIKNITASLTAKRMANAGFEMYEWQTAGDERVRGNPSGRYPNAVPSHWLMDGLICKLDDPTVYSKDGKTWHKRTAKMPKVHPAEAINCRCVQLAWLGV